MQLANRLQKINEPQTIKMAKMSRELRAQGIDIIDLSLGEPDFATPEHIQAAAVQAMKAGYTKYTPVAGYPELREAIVEKLKRDNQVRWKSDSTEYYHRKRFQNFTGSIRSRNHPQHQSVYFFFALQSIGYHLYPR